MIGIRIDIVAHDVPVEKLTAAAVIKVIAGNIWGVRKPDDILTKNSAVLRSSQTFPRLQAKIRTPQAIIIDLIPLNQASRDFLKFKIRLITDIRMAVNPAKYDAYNNDEYESAPPIIFLIDGSTPSPSAFCPVIYSPRKVIKITRKTGIKALLQCVAILLDSADSIIDKSVNGFAPGRSTSPVFTTLVSALCIAPNSRFEKMFMNTKINVKRQ